MDLTENYLDQLNLAQQQAVTHEFGNLLVLAGAGSGKTKVLVNRFAWLLKQCHQDPYHIMVVTFTNKAAKEMADRLHKLNLNNINHAWIGTFHGLSHKFLRSHYSSCGLTNNFEVIDAEDQLKIIRRILKQLNIDENTLDPKKVQHFINAQKDNSIRSNNLPKINSKYDRFMFEIYGHYENACRSQNIVDFSELLLRTYELLSNNIELLQHYRSRFKHFLIDEFQDTNQIQYNFLKLLSAESHSVTAVGDDDQSIYGWRGAKVENIFKFTKDFSEVKIVRLEKNYRSSKTILAAANAIINNNTDRMGKTLWTDADLGKKIILYGALNEEDEAFFIVQEIKKYAADHINYNEMAILYRSNAQSRAIEQALVKHGINYLVYGGVNFFERAEIKDLLAYFRLAINPCDNSAFERIINTPARGIGEKTLEKIRLFSTEHNISLFESTKLLITENQHSSSSTSGLSSFINIMEKIVLCINDQNIPLQQVVENVITITGMMEYLSKQKDANSLNRIENLQELINATVIFNNYQNNTTQQDQNCNIKALLDYAALEGKEYISKEKSNHQEQQQGHVRLMTLHAAKGLEFPVVFLCGLEEGLFPHYLAKDNQDTLNEERRLCYVGITRSQKQLLITYANKRRLFGREESRIRSRFVSEIPEQLITEIKKQIFIQERNAVNSKYLKIPTYNREQPLSKKNSGQKVKHNKFGVGCIIDQEGTGSKTRVQVDFGKKGIKWLLLSYANLEVLN